MTKTPAIALQRRQEAISKFTHKLDTLDELLSDGNLTRFPKRTSILSFATWEDIELGVQSISRSIIYDESDEYLSLRQRTEHLLKRLLVLRTRTGKKANLEDDLRKRLEVAEERAQSYVNQYSVAMAELAEAREENERLNNQLRRHLARETKVPRLKVIRKNNSKSDKQPPTGHE